MEQGVYEFFLVSRASVTCLLCVGQGVDEFFAVVKGVGDVLAERGAGCLRLLLGVKDVCDVLAGRLLRSSSQLSRVSVTCLLSVELSVEVYFLVKGVGDGLLGMEQGVVVLFGVKGVDDVLAVRGAGCLWRCLWRCGG